VALYAHQPARNRQAQRHPLPSRTPTSNHLARPHPRPWLAALADVRSSAADHDLADDAAARRAWFAGATVDEEAVLEGAAGAVEVAEVVDRGALGVDAVEQDRLDGVA
jgi:hypothetical protein